MQYTYIPTLCFYIDLHLGFIMCEKFACVWLMWWFYISFFFLNILQICKLFWGHGRNKNWQLPFFFLFEFIVFLYVSVKCRPAKVLYLSSKLIVNGNISNNTYSKLSLLGFVLFNNFVWWVAYLSSFWHTFNYIIYSDLVLVVQIITLFI